jgi:arsenical pump membrane protein
VILCRPASWQATVSQGFEVPVRVTRGLLIGEDLGLNLSVTGSLATILWLIALRREGEAVTAWQFDSELS